MRWIVIGIVLVALSAGSAAQGPPNTCPALVDFALETVGENCATLDRNQVCYGHDQLSAQTVDGTELSDFAATGDVTAVEQIRTLETAAMDVENGIWGVAVMALQANVPDTLPGQNVVFVVYGAAQLTAEPADDQRFSAPMQAFRLSTGIGQPACSEAPRDGVLLQSPDGATVNFLVNGVEIEMGSTVLIDVREQDELWVSTLEGQATVSAEGESVTVLPGEKVLVTPGQSPTIAEPYQNADVQGVPVVLLPQPVSVPFIVDPAAGTERWIETPLRITSGQTYNFNASGQVNIYTECDAESLAEINLTCDDMIFGPDGGAELGGAPDDYPLPGINVGTLIGRIGLYGEPFVIGANHTFTAESDGTLYVRLNDTFFPEDNTGAFILTVDTASD